LALPPGTRLGTYEVTAQLGEGGMGQVYRATDTKLKRQVAIKVLPPSFAADHDRLARFQREAEVLASLNHPNIAGIYGLEESGSTTALVMELVEGEDLSERLARGAIPVDEALPFAKQIADALEAAHEQGIIHRDLKPANIKVRSDGTVKVLDFGLAKALTPEGSRATADASVSPTITSPAMTQAGMILGTAAYMAPEQARGKAVDKRADIWAFGAVVFEMLTAKRAFGGDDDTVSDVVAAVLTSEPDWTAIPKDAPSFVLPLIRQCLQKDSRKRLPHIGVARLQLEDAWISQPVSKAGQPGRRGLLFVTGIALTVALAALDFAVWGATRSEAAAPSVSRFSVPDTRVLAIFDRNGGTTAVPAPAANINHPRVSPDGKRVAFAIDDDTSSEIWTYELGGATAVRRLTFGGRNRFPIWTNDGERIVFQSDRDGDRGIYWQRADGASAAERMTKAAADDAHVPEAWSPRGDGFLFRIVHGLAHTVQFYSLSQKGFVPFGGIDSRAPTAAAFSPDGGWVAYENGEYGGADRTIFVQPFPATGARYEVPSVGESGRRHPLWSPDGRELFFVTGGEVHLIAAGVRTQPSLTFTNPVVLVKARAWMDSFADAAREWDVLPDGQHFIGKMWARNGSVGPASTPRQVDVVLNWFDELKKRAPAK
jgi:hypothetical protein